MSINYSPKCDFSTFAVVASSALAIVVICLLSYREIDLIFSWNVTQKTYALACKIVLMTSQHMQRDAGLGMVEMIKRYGVDDKHLSACQNHFISMFIMPMACSASAFRMTEIVWWRINDSPFSAQKKSRRNWMTSRNIKKKDFLRYENALLAMKQKLTMKKKNGEPTEIIKRNKLKITQPKWRRTRRSRERTNSRPTLVFAFGKGTRSTYEPKGK